MSLRRAIPVLILSTVLLAGCTGEGGIDGQALDATRGPGSTSRSVPPASEAVADESFGAIAGITVDEEQAPLPNVKVLIVETLAETTSDAEGRFTFNALSPGPYRLIATRPGFQDAHKQVDVAVEVETTLTFVLRAYVVPDDPYHESRTRTANIHFGHSMVTWPVQDIAYANTTLNQMLCEACNFVFHFTPNPKQVLSEATWATGTAGTNTDVWIAHYKNRTAASANYASEYAFYLKSEGATNWTEVALQKFRGWGLMHVHVHGGLTTVNLEHRVTLWYTWSYNGLLPEGFTALPPR